MANQHTQLVKRILSSLVLAPLAIGAVVYGGWAYHCLLALLFVVALHEWSMMARRFEQTFLVIMLGAAYILIGFTSFVIVRADPAQGLAVTLVLLVAVWASDIGGYMFGKGLGGPKIAPHISPGKTYAGLAGAIISGTVVFFTAVLLDQSSLFASELHVSLLSTIDTGTLIAIGFFVGFSGQCGDLLISLVKRKAGVKDTGALIPGHGGVLDRIDALLLAGPVFVVFLMFLV